MKEIVDEFGEPIIAEATTNKVKSDDPGPSPPKKLRATPPLQLQACDSLLANHLAQSAVSGLKKDMQGKIVLRIALDSSMWVLNNKYFLGPNFAAWHYPGFFWRRNLQTRPTAARRKGWACRPADGAL